GANSIVTKRQMILESIDGIKRAIASGRLNSTQTAILQRSLNALGEKDIANGIKLAIGQVERGAAGETGFDTDYLLSYDSAGTPMANITVTFGQNSTISADIVAHEGIHVSDRQELVAAFVRSFRNGNTQADQQYLPENITSRMTEATAFRASAA